MNHIPLEQLQDYADGMSTASSVSEIESHITSCGECGGVLHSMRKMNTLLRVIPLEKVPNEFSNTVLKKLRIQPRSSWVWNVFQYFAPVFALLVISSTVYAFLYFSGAYENSDVQQSMHATKSLYNTIGGGVSQGVSFINSWLGKYVSFAFAKNSYMLTVFLLLFFGAIALLDKFFLASRWRR